MCTPLCLFVLLIHEIVERADFLSLHILPARALMTSCG